MTIFEQTTSAAHPSSGESKSEGLDLHAPGRSLLYSNATSVRRLGSMPHNAPTAAMDAVVEESDFVTPELLDYEPDMDTFQSEVIHGLRQTPKTLPCKFFYDKRGSELFDDICELQEYYPTRTELAIMRDRIGEISELIGPGRRLIEYGSGSSIKTHILLNHLDEVAAYIPVDIARSHLMKSARRLQYDYPDLPILPVCADYTHTFDLPPALPSTASVVYFPGSTIGNFHPSEARDFLAQVAWQCGAGGGLLIGVDLKKDSRVLHAAYNDSRGVTAAFNLNLLTRINRELGADFRPGAFEHCAFYDDATGRIEMHLVSTREQTIRIGTEAVTFADGETIHTECSYKYTIEEFAELAASAGFVSQGVWTDPDSLFSVHYLTVLD